LCNVKFIKQKEEREAGKGSINMRWEICKNFWFKYTTGSYAG